MTDTFHPDRNLPGCMMPDGGECCEGHAAVVSDWHTKNIALMAIKELLGYAANEGKSLAVKESNVNQAWWLANKALNGVVSSPGESK